MAGQHFDRTRASSNENDSKSTTYLEGLILDIRKKMALENPQPAALISDDPTTYTRQRLFLRVWLFRTFRRSGSIACLDEAMYIYRKLAVAHLHDPRRCKQYYIERLAMLAMKHAHLRTSNFFDEAIPIMHEIEATCTDELVYYEIVKDFRMYLVDYAVKTIKEIWLRFKDRSHPYSRRCPDEKILVFRVAILINPHNDLDRRTAVAGLSWYLYERYIATRSQRDLDASIKLFHFACSIPGGTFPLPFFSPLFYSKYRETGNIRCLSDAIDVDRHELFSIQLDHPERPFWLRTLSDKIMERFLQKGETADLEQSIMLSQEALRTLPQGSPSRCGFLNTHSINLSQKYEVYRDLRDLDDAIKIDREALELYPKDDEGRPGMLSDLISSLGYRYLRQMAFADIEESIELSREAVCATPKAHVERACRLYNLSVKISDKFHETKRAKDLEESIKFSREAVEESPENNPNRYLYLDLLGCNLGDLYFITKSENTIDEAIDLLRQALGITPENHQHRPERLNNLASAFLKRYRKFKDMTDLQETIRYLEEAVKTTAPTMPVLAERSTQLGQAFCARYLKTKSRDDAQNAILSDTMALHQLNASNKVRISAGMGALGLSLIISDWENAYHISTVVVGLVPELVLRTLPNSDKQRLIKNLEGLAYIFVAAALYMEKIPYETLIILEQGRSVFLASVEDMQTDIAELQVEHQGLAIQSTALREKDKFHHLMGGVVKGQSFTRIRIDFRPPSSRWG